jgi:hypothetical protein
MLRKALFALLLGASALMGLVGADDEAAKNYGTGK